MYIHICYKNVPKFDRQYVIHNHLYFCFCFPWLTDLYPEMIQEAAWHIS